MSSWPGPIPDAERARRRAALRAEAEALREDAEDVAKARELAAEMGELGTFGIPRQPAQQRFGRD